MRKSLWIIALLFAAIVAPNTRAQITYCYQGNNFTNFDNVNPFPNSAYTTSDSVSGCITLAAALPANGSTNVNYFDPTVVPNFSFTDGVQSSFSGFFSMMYSSSVRLEVE
jgi:hypothetical protein